jgi:hypothetical protein
VIRSLLITTLALILSASDQAVYAQFSSSVCIDSTMISNNTCYGTLYQPVCGCDGKTYRNECNAYAKGLFNFSQGPCESFDFDLNPNPAILDLVINIVTRDVYDVNVWVFDMFYRQKYYQFFPSIYPQTPFPINIDVRGFGNGMYLMVLRCNNEFKLKRLLVNQLND